MTDEARIQCKQALLNREMKIHLCDSCRRKSCHDRIRIEDGRRLIYCDKYKVKTISKEANHE